ncbi:MAG: hypothetical protein ABR955_04890 [Verrucomicrobiota bacterium]|jgi:hypothetical protein
MKFVRTSKTIQVEEVQLMRGGAMVVSLLGAFGQSLKETRLTSWLGYLLSMQPEPFASLFGFKGNVLAVRLETRHEDGRSDILVETSHGLGVIEAKVDATDAFAQSRRYPARWRALLTLAHSNTQRSGIHYVHWQQLVDRLNTVAKTTSPAFKFLATQFITHLEEHHMITKTESLEIYAREINEPITLALFVKGRLYGCKYEKGNKVVRAQYFAPHFGASIARYQPGIFAGISYVARVERVFVATTWREFMDGVCKYRGKQWWNSHHELMKDLHRKWSWTENKHLSFLLLGEPRLVFNPPISKEYLQGGKGWLSRRFFSFDDLFMAWGRKKIKQD